MQLKNIKKIVETINLIIQLAQYDFDNYNWFEKSQMNSNIFQKIECDELQTIEAITDFSEDEEFYIFESLINIYDWSIIDLLKIKKENFNLIFENFDIYNKKYEILRKKWFLQQNKK